MRALDVAADDDGFPRSRQDTSAFFPSRSMTSVDALHSMQPHRRSGKLQAMMVMAQEANNSGGSGCVLVVVSLRARTTMSSAHCCGVSVDLSAFVHAFNQ